MALIITFVKVTALERLHAKHVLPGFADRTAEEREIEAVTSDITKVHLANKLRFRGMFAAPRFLLFPFGAVISTLSDLDYENWIGDSTFFPSFIPRGSKISA
jgi:hypothetical protein